MGESCFIIFWHALQDYKQRIIVAKIEAQGLVSI